MSEIWSKNKYIEICINVLLALMAVNIAHFGQLILPLICLLIFIDRKFRFQVNSWLCFAVLCLFGITFFAFSFRLGIYSTMGFCVPMAYYIGSNMFEPDEGKIKKIVYLLALFMAVHVVLNLGYDFAVHGMRIVETTGHVDIWTLSKMSSTVTAVNLDLLLALSYYIFFYEKNRAIKNVGLVVFLLAFLYCLIMGRRTILLMFVLVVAVNFVLERLIYKTKELKIGIAAKIVVTGALLTAVFIALSYRYDLFGLKEFLSKFYIVVKIMDESFEFERVALLLQSIELRPMYLWGGQNICEIMGMQIHNLWGDIYDYAGVIPYALIIIYTFLVVKKTAAVLKEQNRTVDYKLFMMPVFFCTIIQMFMEPIMTGSSLFLIVTVIILSLNERLIKNGKE